MQELPPNAAVPVAMIPRISHPVWLAGFRPFFALAMLSGALLPPVWVAVFGGALPPPSRLAPLAWHAHEMFYGFGWAALGGFLLTASKNWVGVRGYHGASLAGLVLAWWLDRALASLPAGGPPALIAVGQSVFLVATVAMVSATLWRHRKQDSYADNVYFLILLPLFVPAKLLLLDGSGTAAGVAMSLALFRLAFLIMLERTVTQFMKGGLGIVIARHPGLDHAIKSLGLAAVAAPWVPAALAAGVELALAALLAVRWLQWRPWAALRRLEIGVMYLGYAAIVAQLALAGIDRVQPLGLGGGIVIHVFTFGAMGLILPAMMIRIAKGHTGRKVAFDRLDRGTLHLMLLAFVVRVVPAQLAPAHTLLWLQLAAACWLLCFGLLAWRYIPFLLAPRVDGKEH